jgi:hypothetical protein
MFEKNEKYDIKGVGKLFIVLFIARRVSPWFMK